MHLTLTHPVGSEPGPDAAKIQVAKGDAAQLEVVVSGSVARRVLHASGQLGESGSRLLMALAEQAVRNGCVNLCLDLNQVTVIDLASLRSLRQFQVMLASAGIALRLTDPHRATARPGRTTYTDAAGSAVPD